MKTFEQLNFNSDAVKILMKSTYFTQRKEINIGADIQKLSENGHLCLRKSVWQHTLEY